MASVLTVLTRKLCIQGTIYPWSKLWGLGFPKYGLPVYPPVQLDVFWSLLPPLMFKLLATAWIMVLTRNLGSKSWASFWFWATRMLIFDACCCILFCLCWEFFDNIDSHNSSDITEEVVSIAVAQELILHNLLWPPKVSAKWPQNWVKLSVWLEVCSALWALAA